MGELIKAAGVWIWTHMPVWIKWPIILIVGPNLTVCAIIFFVLVVPFQKEAVRAYVEPLSQRRDAQIQHIIEVQNLQNKAIIDTLNRLDRHQSIMFQAMQTRQN